MFHQNGLICIPVPGQDWVVCDSKSISGGVIYLSRISGGCHLAGKQCTRISCSYSKEYRGARGFLIQTISWVNVSALETYNVFTLETCLNSQKYLKGFMLTPRSSRLSNLVLQRCKNPYSPLLHKDQNTSPFLPYQNSY